MSPDQHSSTGVVRHGAHVALTPARALTSHARKHYEQKYMGRYRSAAWVFAFDMALLVILVSLIGFNLAWMLGLGFSRSPIIQARIQTATLVAGAVTQVEAVISVGDQRVHRNVRLSWQLPPWVQMVRAEPSLSTDGSMIIPRLVPGEEVRVHLFVRVLALPGDRVPLTLYVQEGSLWSQIETHVTQEQIVASTDFRLKPALEVQKLAPGASLPLLVSNRSSVSATGVILRLLKKNGAPQAFFSQNREGDEHLGEMAPGETRLVYLDMGDQLEAHMDLELEVQEASIPVARLPLSFDRGDEPRFQVSDLSNLSLTATSVDVDYKADVAGGLWVAHPFQTDTKDGISNSYDIAEGTGRLHLTLQPTATSTAQTYWTVIPFEKKDGSITLGARSTGLLGRSLPFTTTARYYAVTGDQLGIGPLPPRHGETTSYWIVWSLGPTHEDLSLRNVMLKTRLADHVRATGRFSSNIDGVFEAHDRDIAWQIPQLSLGTAEPIVFAYEIQVQPTENDRGHVMSLVDVSEASGVELSSGATLRAMSDPQDTNLKGDDIAKEKGIVE